MDKFSLDQARNQGWGPWMGAAAHGITGHMGMGGQPTQAAQGPAQPPQGAGTSMGGYMDGPQAVADRMPNGGLLNPDTDPVMGGSYDYAGGLAAIGKLASNYAKDNASQDAAAPMVPAQVLQPLRRFTLGKGLLG